MLDENLDVNNVEGLYIRDTQLGNVIILLS